MTRNRGSLSKQRTVATMVTTLLPKMCKRPTSFVNVGCICEQYKCWHRMPATQPPTSPQSGSSQGTLQRGKACILCRRRKMRCDGVRPICGPCSRLTRPQDCEYTDNQGRTQTERLEERLAHLQVRLRELENPEENEQPVFLHDPHAPRTATGAGSSEIRSPLRTSSSSTTANSGFDFADYMSSATDAQLGIVTPPMHPMPHASVASIYNVAGIVAEPTAEVTRQMINMFFEHAIQLGFALNKKNFIDSLSLPQDHSSRPHPALENSVYLWSARLAQRQEVTAMEPIYLSRAIRALTDILGKPGNPQRRVQGIQAEVLLALYFFYVGRLLEGRYHAAAAMSLAVSCRLHKIDAPPSPSTGTGLSNLVLPLDSFNLPATLNVVQEGERINLFWVVFAMDRCWSVGVGSSVILSEGGLDSNKIQTAWPISMTQYERGNIRKNETGSDTLLALMEDSAGSQSPLSSLALRVKASTFFERATRFSSRFDTSHVRSEEFNRGIDSLQRHVRRFVAFLSSISNTTNITDNENNRRQFIVTYTLAHASLVQLHNPFADAVPASYNSCLQAARESVLILDLIKDNDLNYLDPFIGVTWLSAARVLLREILVSKNPVPGHSQSAVDIRVIRSEFSRLLGVMDQFGRLSPLIAHQADTVRQMKEAIDNPGVRVTGSLGDV